MALFEKKFCDLCGEKVNLLTRQKLEDGFLCADCKHKLSCFSRNWDDRTLSDVKAHLDAREANKAKFAQFSATSSAGKSNELMVDAAHRQFCYAIGRDYKNGNPEVFDFSQLQSFWIEEKISSYSTDSDGDGIPDSQDNFNNRTGRVENNNTTFNNGMMNNMIMNNMMGNMTVAPLNIQQYIRRTDNNSNSNNVQKYVSSLEAHFSVNHSYITEISFDIDNSISKDNSSELVQAYNYASQIVQLCEQIKGLTQQQYQQPVQQGYTQQQYQQPVQQGYTQQQYQQPVQQGYTQQQYQQPVQQGYNQQQYQQPVQQGYTQQQYQQPVQQGYTQQQYQQPVQQATAAVAAVMPFCSSCGTQNSTGASFCPNCGSSLKK